MYRESGGGETKGFVQNVKNSSGIHNHSNSSGIIATAAVSLPLFNPSRSTAPM